MIILTQTKNIFFVENFMKFLYETLHSKIIVENSKQTDGSQKITLKNFASLLDKFCLQIFLNIGTKETKTDGEENKKTDF